MCSLDIRPVLTKLNKDSSGAHWSSALTYTFKEGKKQQQTTPTTNQHKTKTVDFFFHLFSHFETPPPPGFCWDFLRIKQAQLRFGWVHILFQHFATESQPQEVLLRFLFVLNNVVFNLNLSCWIWISLLLTVLPQGVNTKNRITVLYSCLPYFTFCLSSLSKPNLSWWACLYKL